MLGFADNTRLEMLRTFNSNPTCRHIIFGGCHDNGYLQSLDQFKHNELTAARITLLETTPARKGFTDLLHFKRARFENVFKAEPLPESIPPALASPPSAFVSVSAPLAQSQGVFRTNSNQSPRPSVSSPSPNTPPSSVSGQENNGDTSWGTYRHYVSICPGVMCSG
jgi:hypothetical protein